HIQFYSEPGQGTTFKIYLPCVKGDKQPSQKQHASMEPPYGSETVLLVEGHDMVRDPLKRILQGYGYGVLEAQNGDEALKVSAEHDGPIHLMVTEVLTPGMSGLELAERLHPLRSDMKVLYMSGAVDYSTGRNGALDRRVPFLQKPFTPEEVAHKVREVLDAPLVREDLSPK
ncbi:MAG TPA: response regulator, partial [Acidobacteriota bacterium]|nr:response regulator [Acidobacteriota bacterium]